MVQRGSPWVIEGTAATSGHLCPRRNPHCIDWSSRVVAIMSCGGIAVTVDVKDGVAKAPLPKGVSKLAQSDVCIVVNPQNDFIPQGKGCIDGLEHVLIKAQ